MSSIHDDPKLSLLEQAILAQLSTNRPTQVSALASRLARVLALEDRSTFKREKVEPAIANLREQGFVETRALQKTERGSRALRDQLGLRNAPKLKEWCKIQAARSLGLSPGSEQARNAFASTDGIALAIVRQRVPLPPGATALQVGDALLAEHFGLGPGPVTLKRIRDHLLGQRVGGGMPTGLRAAAAKYAKTSRADKASLIDALARQALNAEIFPAQLASRPRPPTGDPTLLSAVHDAIANVGADGRVGQEKVFVSAIWHHIASDRRVSNLSLDGFKRWLLHANRDQLLSLARADAVNGMDPRLVAESEIESLGASFHFVVDARQEQVAP